MRRRPGVRRTSYRVARRRLGGRGALHGPAKSDRGRCRGAARLSRLDRDGHVRPYVREQPHLDGVDPQRPERLVQDDLRLIDLGLHFLGERFGDLLGRNAPERLSLTTGFELEHERYLMKALGEIFGVAVSTVALALHGFPLLREMLQLSAGGLDREAL